MSLFTSENQIVCFPSFVLTVFWCSTSYTVFIVFWMMLMEPVDAPARWWLCACLKSVSGLWRLDKTLNFRDAYVSLTWSSNMVQTQMKETGYNFSLTSLYWWVELPPLLEWVFFSAVFRVLDWSFLVLPFDGNVCNWIPKVTWPRKVWFLSFLLGNGFFRRLHICVEWNLQELLNCCSFLTTSNFFDV